MTTSTLLRLVRSGHIARPTRSPRRVRKAGPNVSMQAWRWAMRQRTGSPVSKVVLLVLADHHNARTGLCSPSTRVIAEEAETDQRTARRHLDALATQGLVSWTGGFGRGRNRYALPIGSEGQDPSQDDGRNEGWDPSQDADVVRGETPHSTNGSEAPENRSEALILRSEATRASDQQKQKSNRTTYLTEVQEPAAAPLPARTRGRGGAQPREHPTPADLNGTATRLGGYQIVSEWARANPGVLTTHRRALGKLVDQMLAEGAVREHFAVALTAAHGPRWKSPLAGLRHTYDDARRAAANAPVATYWEQ